jgi:hypothetical protein
MKHVALAVMAGLLSLTPGLVQPAVAQSTEHTTQIQLKPSEIPAEHQATPEQLHKLFDEMRIKTQIGTVMQTMTGVVQKQLQDQLHQFAEHMPDGKKPTAEEEKQVSDLMSKYMKRAAEIMPIDEMIGDMVAVYQRHISREDVDAMIAFYGTPAAQHLLDAQPAISQETMPVMMARVQERMKALNEDMYKDLQTIYPSQTNNK